MNLRHALICAACAGIGLWAAPTHAQNKVAVHGSVQADILFPEKDHSIGAIEDYDSPILFNTYADVTLASKYVDAGLRFDDAVALIRQQMPDSLPEQCVPLSQ